MDSTAAVMKSIARNSTAEVAIPTGNHEYRELNSVVLNDRKDEEDYFPFLTKSATINLSAMDRPIDRSSQNLSRGVIARSYLLIKFTALTFDRST